MMVVVVMAMMVVRRRERGIGAKEHQNGDQTGYLHENISC
jgi:hypothetical protein